MPLTTSNGRITVEGFLCGCIELAHLDEHGAVSKNGFVSLRWIDGMFVIRNGENRFEATDLKEARRIFLRERNRLGVFLEQDEA